MIGIFGADQNPLNLGEVALGDEVRLVSDKRFKKTIVVCQ
jgi:hypothetical protein